MWVGLYSVPQLPFFTHISIQEAEKRNKIDELRDLHQNPAYADKHEENNNSKRPTRRGAVIDIVWFRGMTNVYEQIGEGVNIFIKVGNIPDEIYLQSL